MDLKEAREEYAVHYLEEFTKDAAVETTAILEGDPETLAALLSRAEPTQTEIGEAAKSFQDAHLAAVQATMNARNELQRWIDRIARRDAHEAARRAGMTSSA